jgi:transposase-like protein
MGAFPTQESVLRLVVLVLIDITEDWITGNKYKVMEQNKKKIKIYRVDLQKIINAASKINLDYFFR